MDAKVYEMYRKMSKQMYGKRGLKKRKLFKNLRWCDVHQLEKLFNGSFYFVAEVRYMGNKKWELLVCLAPKDRNI